LKVLSMEIGNSQNSLKVGPKLAKIAANIRRNRVYLC
jgi:hypothetical protein